MAVNVRDNHLEEQVRKEKALRGDRSMTKTLSDLARERLTELAMIRRGERGGHRGKREKANAS